ncbi:MAG TPA: hypothetical protein VFA47_09090 [Candidatus Manganitrophaceae bacterium]|nr:hypothetical protein [Candidatus Manganitrophaceae bacterium]
MDFDWERLQKEMNEAAMGEKISADIEKKYATLVNDFTKDKFPEWQEKVGTIVRNMVQANKDHPEAAAEALILVILQMIHHIAQHEVSLEYKEQFNNKLIDAVAALERRTTGIAQALIRKGILSVEDVRE